VDELLVTYYMFLGVLLRFVLPFLITFFLTIYLRSLDTKWRDESRNNQPGEAVLYRLWLNNPCSDVNNCGPKECEACLVYGQYERSCWEVNRVKGQISTKCQECEYRERLLFSVVEIKGILG
jgi:hypothetical protein